MLRAQHILSWNNQIDNFCFQPFITQSQFFSVCMCQIFFFLSEYNYALVLVNLITRFCQMRQMEHQTENSPRPSSVCALPCLMSFSFTQQIVFVCLRFVINSTSWMEKTVSKLPVNCYKCTNRILCLTPRFGIEHVLSSSLLCGDIGHCFLLLLMVIVLFTIREKQDGFFSC